MLQEKTSDVGDSVATTERSQEICDQCQINIKSLFVLEQTGFMHGYIVRLVSLNIRQIKFLIFRRLEAELFELAYNYYHNAVKRVKSHKSSLTKASQQVRA